MRWRYWILMAGVVVGGAAASLSRPSPDLRWTAVQGRIQVDLPEQSYNRFELRDLHGRYLASGNVAGRSWFDLPVFRGCATLRLMGQDTAEMKLVAP